jgi:hypothetical protein
LQTGKLEAAKLTEEQAGWSKDWWLGITESGRRVTVATPHYTNHDWHRAYYELVVAELLQSIGRARSILEDGIDCVVVTTENLAPLEDGIDGRNGYPIAEAPFDPLTDSQWNILRVLKRGPCKMGELVSALGMKRQSILEQLMELEAAGRVEKVGARGGWKVKL